MPHLMLLRFSALGDVAMTIPVAYALAHSYPQAHFTLVTRKAFVPLFAAPPANLRVVGIDLKEPKYRGIMGIFRLYRKLCALQPTHVADLHGVLRTRLLRWLFALNGIPTRGIKKYRKLRKALTQRPPKTLSPLPDTFSRYTEVIHRCGYAFVPHFKGLFSSLPPVEQICTAAGLPTPGKPIGIGIAPFAAHRGKCYPSEKMKEVVRLLARRTDLCIYLFGGGKAEAQLLESWASQWPNVHSTVGKLGFENELKLMSHLRVMVCMDSGNMHLASLVATPVVSVWGATHPCAGFYGWGQHPEDAVQTAMECRPCSIFGNKPCHRGDYACMEQISPAHIVSRVEAWLPPAKHGHKE